MKNSPITSGLLFKGNTERKEGGNIISISLDILEDESEITRGIIFFFIDDN